MKQSIETWAATMSQGNPLLSLARRGEMPAQALAFYLTSLRFLFRNSQHNLGRAGRLCLERGEDELGAYLLAKAREEVGHDGWADDDLRKLPASLARSEQPAVGVVKLVQLQGELIERDPLAFLAYSLWAEYFTVLLGDEWVEALTASGYAPDQLTAVTKHVEADRAHAEAGLSDIDRFGRPDTDAESILGGVREAELLFEAFCDEVHACALEARRASKLAG